MNCFMLWQRISIFRSNNKVTRISWFEIDISSLSPFFSISYFFCHLFFIISFHANFWLSVIIRAAVRQRANNLDASISMKLWLWNHVGMGKWHLTQYLGKLLNLRLCRGHSFPLRRADASLCIYSHSWGIWGGLWFSGGGFLAGAGGWVHFGGESGGEFIILGSFEIFLIFPNFLRS